MWKKNQVQKNFKEQIEHIEKQMKIEEEEGMGAFSNISYKEKFYGKHYDEEESKASRIMRNPNHPIYRIIGIIIVIGGFLFLSLLDNGFTSPATKAEKYYNEGNYEKALESYNKLTITNKNDFYLLYNKGKTLIALQRYAEAVEVFKNAEKIREDDEDLYLELGYAYYNLGSFKESISTYKKALNIDANNVEAITWIAYNNMILENFDEAMTLCDKALEIDKEFAFAYETKGELYATKGDFNEAIKYYDIAIEKDSSYDIAYINKVSALYRQGDYVESINFALEANKLFPEESEILYWLGDCYAAINEGDTAIKYYEEALKLNETNVELVARLGWEHYYGQDYEKAKIYSDKALNIDDTNKSALSLSKAIKAEERPEAEKIVDFVKENYLYIDNVIDFEEKSKEFLAKDNINNEDIKKFINSIKIDNDIFTFVLSDKVYEEYIAESSLSHISSKLIDPKSLYVKIESFTPSIDKEFRSIINKVEESESMNLIIDLRDNGGGLAVQANNILDMLLPERTISYMIDRKGRVGDFYSGESCTKFNKIIVMVNEKSASSSELLALGLRKHLNNVTIIGKPTFGKGVGQISYESKARKYSIFLVNFYWNVKEQNIAGDKIYPDVRVAGSKTEDYIKTVEELTKR